MLLRHVATSSFAKKFHNLRPKVLATTAAFFHHDAKTKTDEDDHRFIDQMESMKQEGELIVPC